MKNLSLAVLLSAAALPAQLAFAQTPAPAAPAPSAADKQLKALYEGYSDWVAKEFGYFQDAKGEEQQGGTIAHVDPASNIRRAEHEKQLLAQLNAIPAAQLSADEKVNAGVLRQILENDVADAKYREWEMPANSDSNFWTYLDERNTLSDAGAYQRYIGRMRDLPRYFDENIANMQAGLKRGFTPPAATLVGRDGSIASFVKDRAEDSSFYSAFKDMPSNISAADAAKLRAEGKAVIEQSVIPAYRKLLAFYRDSYVPNVRKSVSAHDLPDGDAFYRAQIREYTTTDMTPEDIHQLGLKEVARIQANMETTMKESGFKGTFAEFLTFLRTDPQFIARNPDDLLGVSAYAAKRVDGKLSSYFEVLPRRRFTIIPVPDALAPFYTAGRGGLESCQMNTYNLATRPLYNIPVLTLHECVPGHSFQAALSVEQQTLPAFRQNLYFSGYGEGWGLYSEWLGNEMGIYRTPYEKFGQLSYEMWRAARLVIDTGIHQQGWSRLQAIDYLANQTALTQHEVETEVDRYISWPGQALAYKLGELTILRLRHEAEATLGPKFDERRFHDAVLGLGSVPLTVFEDQMHAFIREEAARPISKPAAAS
jgi:uncharacterized protein (DUF885 family)